MNLTQINNEENMEKMKFLGQKLIINQEDTEAEFGKESSEIIDFDGLHVLAMEHFNYHVQKISALAQGQTPEDTLKCS